MDGLGVDQLVQMGAAGSVILVTGMFLKYLSSRDAGVQNALHELTAAIHQLVGREDPTKKE